MCRLILSEMDSSQIAEGEKLATAWLSGSQHYGKRVLVVDGEEPIREIIASMLGVEGFKVRQFERALDALAFLDESGSQVDLITSCLLMPDLDGIGFLKQAKRKHPEIPFAVVSAIHDLDVAEYALRAGACDYLLKPFATSQLCAMVYRSLRT